eukprot:TRINITY_DN1104_c0_g1_i1.p1 TRINITY_DN1104_c0_g1~~TRINITY_DN1104_c0_g1_i1.p1  ORF type:complete len:317 (+),score=62.93 TRINITY_DN1104_c0_g1_i1:45-995(+)
MQDEPLARKAFVCSLLISIDDQQNMHSSKVLLLFVSLCAAVAVQGQILVTKEFLDNDCSTLETQYASYVGDTCIDDADEGTSYFGRCVLGEEEITITQCKELGCGGSCANITYAVFGCDVSPSDFSGKYERRSCENIVQLPGDDQFRVTTFNNNECDSSEIANTVEIVDRTLNLCSNGTEPALGSYRYKKYTCVQNGTVLLNACTDNTCGTCPQVSIFTQPGCSPAARAGYSVNSEACVYVPPPTTSATTATSATTGSTTTTTTSSSSTGNITTTTSTSTGSSRTTTTGNQPSDAPAALTVSCVVLCFAVMIVTLL